MPARKFAGRDGARGRRRSESADESISTSDAGRTSSARSRVVASVSSVPAGAAAPSSAARPSHRVLTCRSTRSLTAMNETCRIASVDPPFSLSPAPLAAPPRPPDAGDR